MLRKRINPGMLWAAVLAFQSVAASGQTNFATLVPDGAWTWFNDPRALFHNRKLYFGYVRAGDGRTTLSAFDLITGKTTNLWSSGFTELDDHNNPALLVRSDGRLLVAYSRHNNNRYFAYRSSKVTHPHTSAGWNDALSILDSGAGMTYANLFQLSAEDGRIYNFCRNLNFNPTIYTSEDGGRQWSGPQLFIKTGTQGKIRPYVKYSSDYRSRIDFLYTDGHPNNVANSLYHLFYTDRAFYRTDGSFVAHYAYLPIQHDAGQRGSVIYQFSNADTTDFNEHIPTGRAWCWEIASQSNGAPVCVFSVQRDFASLGGRDWKDDRIYYYYARWTGTNWQKRFIAQAGRPLYAAEEDYAGGICVDPIEPSAVYCSSNAQDPFDLSRITNVRLRANNRYELWRGVTADGGLTFSWSQVTTNSTADNLRPYVPRRNGGERCVIWFRGNYTTYTSYRCSVVGLFTTPVPVHEL
ncbi:MAG TPA: BNR-4 repeat-containing protein [Verrucomicrobiae bacterium]|nr:BNR-4 repeat-containing protein [Verrucomicrobiae bacterium]